MMTPLRTSMVALGTTKEGKTLLYNEQLYEFMLDRDIVDLSQVRHLDGAGSIKWRFIEHRDWFKRLDGDVFSAAHAQALAKGDGIYDGMSAEERVRADAARDDSILAGKIVEADPALVHAVVHAIESDGLMSLSANSSGNSHPFAQSTLPKGMEALSQMERARGGERTMTLAEKRLMKRILKNDDKEKRRREKRAEKLANKRSDSASDDAAENAKTGNAPNEGDTNGAEHVSVSEAPRPVGRFEAFVESAFTKMNGKEKSIDELNKPDVESEGSGKERSARKGEHSDKKGRKASKSQTQTVPGMKEAQSRGGLLGFFSSKEGPDTGKGRA